MNFSAMSMIEEAKEEGTPLGDSVSTSSERSIS